METIAREAEHATVIEWAEEAVKALPSIVATAATLAGLADVSWRPMVIEGRTSIEITLTGQLGAAYSGRAARVEIARYARVWGTGGGVHIATIDGRVIATAMVKVEGFAVARVWADTGPVDDLDVTIPGSVQEQFVRDAAERIPAAMGSGVA